MHKYTIEIVYRMDRLLAFTTSVTAKSEVLARTMVREALMQARPDARIVNEIVIKVERVA